MLYKIEENSFRSLDRYEGVPEHYRRIEIQVTPDGDTTSPANGQPVPAQVYIASKIEKGLRPSAQYLQAILDGAGEHSLPAAYIGERSSPQLARPDLLFAHGLSRQAIAKNFPNLEGPWQQRRCREQRPAEAVS